MQRFNALRLFVVFCCALLAGLCPARAADDTGTAYPKIVLLRHAEKPWNAHVIPDLTPDGYMRAAKIAPFLQEKYGKPDFIFAAKSSKSKRPVETITPYSKATGVPIDSTFDGPAYQDLAHKLLTDKQFAGKLVVVCWRHEDMPQFAHSLNAPDGTYPAKWAQSLYNLVLQFDYKDSKVPKVTQITEPF